MINRLAIWVLLSMLSLPAYSQLSSQRCKWVPAADTAFVLDSLSLAPGSITFASPGHQDLLYSYNANTNELKFINPAGDSVLVCYRVLPLSLIRPRYKRDIYRVQTATFDNDYYFEDFSVKEEIFKTPGLNKSGNITRGISFGNNQNVFVNSSLNLQLDGKLSEDIDITAAITDQNIPFQPEGNTQQLQEFDRVYITLKHRLWNLTAGDVVLQNKPTHFLRFYKNVQGGAFQVRTGKTIEKTGATMVAASVSKGKFASLSVDPIEGVQGPYRLRGPLGEKFIVILANSERVFLDGVLLTRGFDFDYVIDYNQAEITFTPRHIITKNSRIKVDYEYSDLNYSRGIYHLNHYQKLNKLNLNVNYYNEADNPNNQINLNLRPEDKRILSEAGDNLQQAVSQGGTPVAYDRQLVLYVQEDTTLANGTTLQIYRYEPDTSSQTFYNVQFTDVGQGNGDYVQASASVNGRVFQWVAPENGQRTGRYIPVRILPAPKKKQMVTVGGSYDVDKNSNVFFELASSENDLNRFSNLDDADDDGRAMKVGYATEGRQFKFMDGYNVRSQLSYEFTDKYFTPIDRYRDIEFDRDWSANIATTTQRDDNIFNFAIGAEKDPLNMVGYRISRRYRKSEVNGVQHYLNAARKIGLAELRGNFFMLNSTSGPVKSDWVRGDFGSRFVTRYIVPGYVYRFDKNKLSPAGRDSVVSSAIYFDEHQFFVESSDTARTKYRLDYSYRQDFIPVGGELRLPETAQTYNGSVNSRIGKNNTLNLLATYRTLDSRNNADSLRESTIMTRTDWNGDFFDRHLQSELSYTIATGRELKREYTFQPTLPGQGTHYLIQGGDPKNLNDYFEAQTSDPNLRTHIKFYFPTDEYIVAYTNRFTYRLSSNMPRNWRTEKGLREFLSKFSAISFVSIDKKTTDEDLASRFNPFSQEIEDRFLISLSKSLRNTVYYNRSNPKFGLEFTVLENQQKSLLLNGTETRNLSSQNLVYRNNLSQQFTSKLNLSRTIRENTSNFLTARNFRIVGYEGMPELAWQPKNTLRFTGTYGYIIKENKMVVEGVAPQKADFHEFGLESRISQVSKRTLTTNIKYIKVSYNADPNTAIGYEILNALRPGSNVTWNLSLQQRLSNGLNISANYDGRKSQDVNAVHTGRMQVSVLF